MLRRIIGAEVRFRVVVRTAGATVVRIAPQQLDQVILNLAVNARDAMPGGGQIPLRVDADSTCAFIDVIDTGCGIPEDIADQIFEPFFTTKDEERGTGLGMWIFRKIVDEVGGLLSITSTSRPGFFRSDVQDGSFRHSRRINGALAMPCADVKSEYDN